VGVTGGGRRRRANPLTLMFVPAPMAYDLFVIRGSCPRRPGACLRSCRVFCLHCQRRRRLSHCAQWVWQSQDRIVHFIVAVIDCSFLSETHANIIAFTVIFGAVAFCYRKDFRGVLMLSAFLGAAVVLGLMATGVSQRQNYYFVFIFPQVFITCWGF